MSDNTWFFDLPASRSLTSSPVSVRKGYTSPIFSLVPDANDNKSLAFNPITPNASPTPARREVILKSPASLFTRVNGCFSTSTPSLHHQYQHRTSSPLSHLIPLSEGVPSRRSRFASSDLFPTEPRSKSVLLESDRFHPNNSLRSRSHSSRPHSSASMMHERDESKRKQEAIYHSMKGMSIPDKFGLDRGRSVIRTTSPLIEKYAWLSTSNQYKKDKAKADRTTPRESTDASNIESSKIPSKLPLDSTDTKVKSDLASARTGKKVDREETASVTSTTTIESKGKIGNILAQTVSTTSVTISKTTDSIVKSPSPVIDKRSTRTSPSSSGRKDTNKPCPVHPQGFPSSTSILSAPSTSLPRWRHHDVMETIVHHEVKAEVDKKRAKERSSKENQRKREKKSPEDKRKNKKTVEEKENKSSRRMKREPYYKPKSPAPPVDIPMKPYSSTSKSEVIKERFATPRDGPSFTLSPAPVSTVASFNPPTPPLTARYHQVHLPSSSLLPEGEEGVPTDTHAPRSLPSVSDITVRIPAVKSSQHRIIIRGGRVVNDDGITDADVYIEEGIIRQVGPNLIVPGGCRVVEAKGHYVIPGGIDPHTHFETEFMSCKTADDYYSGSRAAVAGGTTTIINHIIQPGVNPFDAFKRAKAIASDKICCDFGFHASITEFKEGSTEKDIENLIREGVNSVKVFMAYKDYLQLTDDKIIKVFDICKRLGVLPLVHAENGDVIDFLTKKLVKVGITGPEGHLQSRPEDVEAEATHRAITLADSVGAPLFVVHVMSKSASDEITRARSNGKVVFGEVVASALALDGTQCLSRCWAHAAAHIMSPPLRPDVDTPSHLMNLLGCGQLQVTGSDHCVFNSKDKKLGEKDFRKIPNGVNGVEERLSILWEKGVKTGKLSLTDFVAVSSSNAAKIFNMYPRKGKIAVGSDADVVVFGRKPGIISKNQHHSAVDFNIFEGIHTEFNPIVVVAGGKIVLDEEGKLHISQGSGKFIPRPASSTICFSRLVQRDLNLGPFKVDRSQAAAHDKNGVVSGGDAVTPVKQKESGLHIVTDLDALRTSEHPGHSPSGSSSTGSLTPTGFHKTITKSGVRSQQDSNFKLTGQQIDDDKLGRTSVKLHQPPGGKSSGIW